MLLRVVIFWGPYDQRSSYGPKKLNGTIGLHQDKESIDRSKPGNVLPFCQCEIRTMNERFTHVHGYCCRDQAASNVGKIRFTRMANSFVRPRQNWARTTNDNSRFILFAEEVGTHKSHFAQKKSQSRIFDEPNYVFIYIHRVKTTSFQWTSHISWHCGPLYWIKKESRRREKT